MKLEQAIEKANEYLKKYRSELTFDGYQVSINYKPENAPYGHRADLFLDKSKNKIGFMDFGFNLNDPNLVRELVQWGMNFVTRITCDEIDPELPEKMDPNRIVYINWEGRSYSNSDWAEDRKLAKKILCSDEPEHILAHDVGIMVATSPTTTPSEIWCVRRGSFTLDEDVEEVNLKWENINLNRLEAEKPEWFS